MAQITHVIFDMDGLILNTEELYTEVNQRALAEYGKEFSWECKSKQMGRKKDEAIQILIDHYELSITVAEYRAKIDKLDHEVMPKAKLLPGAERLIRHLSKNNIPIAVATGSYETFFDIKTEKYRDLFSLFHHILCGDDPELKRGKPSPDCFLICASRFEPPVSDMSRVLIFEDAPNGVEAALAAGSQVVMVPDPRVCSSVKGRATVALSTLEDFLPENFGLPPF